MPQPMPSDLSLDLSAFSPAATAPSTHALNASIISKCKQDEKWWVVGASTYREKRAAGQTPFPPAPRLDDLATTFSITSPKTGAEIPCRTFLGAGNGDASSEAVPRGVFYHIHGGGYVLGSAAGQDLLLHEIQSKTGLAVVSVDYRLAPEHAWPAALEDCCDVAEWLLQNADNKFGAPLRFIGGESAGATLTALVMQHLQKQANLSLSSIAGLVLNYGAFDLSYLPSCKLLDPTAPLVLSYEDAERFADAYIPSRSSRSSSAEEGPKEGRKDPRVSPLYATLEGLGSALFLVGTVDGLLDDSILMAAKWQIAGNEAVLKFVPGGAHGFMTFDGSVVEVTRRGWDVMLEYIDGKLSGVGGVQA